MTEHSKNYSSQETPTLPVLIVGCSKDSAQPWRHACEQLKLEAISLSQSSDCRSYIAAHGGACVVAATWPKVDASMLDASDHSFKRATIMLVSQKTSEVDLWQAICWDNYYEGVTVETAIEAIKAGTIEAMKRRDDWNQVEAFHHHEAALNNDESLVMVSICQGLLNKQIASNFGVSIRTIEQRRRHVFEKMEVDSVAPLASLVAKVREIERRGRRRNSPDMKRNRFWKNWDSPHATAGNPPHTETSQKSGRPHIRTQPSQTNLSNNSQLGT